MVERLTPAVFTALKTGRNSVSLLQYSQKNVDMARLSPRTRNWPEVYRKPPTGQNKKDTVRFSGLCNKSRAPDTIEEKPKMDQPEVCPNLPTEFPSCFQSHLRRRSSLHGD